MPEPYNIGSGLSEQELQFASFWVRNHLKIRAAGFGLLAALSALLWIFVIWSLLDAYAISYPRENRIPRRIMQNALVTDSLLATTPKSVQISEVSVFNATEGRQDMLVELTNPNEQWNARFDYSFELAGERTPIRQGYILPSSRRYLTELGYAGKSKGQTAKLVVENIRWERINPSEVDQDYKTFAERRLLVTSENIKYENDVPLASGVTGRTSFLLKNESAYGFWSSNVHAVLFRGSSPVGVTSVAVRELKPGEIRPMEIDWFDNLTGISKTEVRIDVDILNPQNYLPTSRF